ncbi:Bgt-5067 [Blumeria graminis f. sp. tritici]|uniref:Largest subunit of the origin recognition complex n=3 Tax=Blumeria graminis f. sp. tritici TaxID=62690 RepID=A0A656KFL9_BLUGR|nr:Largest subunit of the origin recognition complex [Blumeria graminis f. sp. tritici 96224]VDB92547.1 Bgt-5067 [Blumeria graminis f. sp. tritici]
MTLNSDSDAYISESNMETEWEWIYGEIHDDIKTATKATLKSSAEISRSISGQIEGRGSALALSGKRLIGARNAKFQFGIGDAVLVNCGDPTPWIAIVRSIDQTVPGEEKVDVLCKLSSKVFVMNFLIYQGCLNILKSPIRGKRGKIIFM